MNKIKRDKVETETLVALASNDSITSAAMQLGISRLGLYKRIEKYNLTAQLKNIQEAAIAELSLGAGKAARNLVNKIDHADPDISLKSSAEVLDRVGLTKVSNKQEGGNNDFHLHLHQSEQRKKYDL